MYVQAQLQSCARSAYSLVGLNMATGRSGENMAQDPLGPWRDEEPKWKLRSRVVYRSAQMWTEGKAKRLTGF